MAGNTQAALAKQVVSFATDFETPVWTVIPKVNSVGATGEMGSAKDKTTLDSDVMEYGSAMPDTPDKDIKGQVLEGDAGYKAFETAADAKQTVLIKVVWPNLDKGMIVKVVLFGHQMDENSSQDWATYTVKGKQTGASQKGDSSLTWVEPA